MSNECSACHKFVTIALGYPALCPSCQRAAHIAPRAREDCTRLAKLLWPSGATWWTGSKGSRDYRVVAGPTTGAERTSECYYARTWTQLYQHLLKHVEEKP